MPRNTNAKPEVDAAPLRVIEGGAASTEPLDCIIHERQRLAIVSALAVNRAMSFTELKQALGMSDGNLSVHAQKLEQAGYIECSKGFEGRVPRTEYKLTRQGKAALNAYLSHMEAIIDAVRNK